MKKKISKTSSSHLKVKGARTFFPATTLQIHALWPTRAELSSCYIHEQDKNQFRDFVRSLFITDWFDRLNQTNRKWPKKINLWKTFSCHSFALRKEIWWGWCNILNIYLYIHGYVDKLKDRQIDPIAILAKMALWKMRKGGVCNNFFPAQRVKLQNTDKGWVADAEYENMLAPASCWLTELPCLPPRVASCVSFTAEITNESCSFMKKR